MILRWSVSSLKSSFTELPKIFRFSAICSVVRHTSLTMNDEDKKLEALAEQWVNILFAHIEAKKQQKAKGLKKQKSYPAQQ